MSSPQSPAESRFDAAAWLSHILSRFPGLHRANGRPLTVKELQRGRRKLRADSLRLARLSRPWRTARQLELLQAMPRGPQESFRFAVLGDAEPGRFWIWRKLFNVLGSFESQVREIQTRGVDFSIQLGDMVSRGTMPNYLAFFRELSTWGVRTPYLTVIGNHDRFFPHGFTPATLYRACFGRTNYFFDRGPARFVVVDSSLFRVNSLQLRWLDRALDTDKIKLVFTHIPPAQLGCWTDYVGQRGIGGFHRGSAQFTEVMSRRGVDRVYMGHIHAFGVQDYKGVRYVLTGGGGSPLFPCGVQDRYHHYLVVTVGPDGVRETLHSTDGRTLCIPRGKVLLKNC